MEKYNEELREEIGWLSKLVDGLRTLDAKEFKFERFVSEFNKETGCGTVCCAYGWMPRFVPESGVKWASTDMEKSPYRAFTNIGMIDYIITHHDNININGSQIIDFMFMGNDYFGTLDLMVKILKEHNKDMVEKPLIESLGCRQLTLPQVINRIQSVVWFLEDCLNKNYVIKYDRGIPC